MVKLKHTPRQLMEIALEEMLLSVPEHFDRMDPKVGAVLATEQGELIDKAHRGELRSGDHAEFTVLERKNRNKKLDGLVIYATLEPCAPGARSSTKLGCAERIVNARVKTVYVGIEDPDPKVRGNGIAFLKNHGIQIEFFDQDLQVKIFEKNAQFIREATDRAKQADLGEIQSFSVPIEAAIENYEISDFSDVALQKFKEKLKIDYDINSTEFKSVLQKWNFIRLNLKSNKLTPTGLGILLFGKHPQILYPQSLVKFTVVTKNETKIIDFDGPLVLIPEKIESYLELHFPKILDRSSFARKETRGVYFEVLREIIVNAIVHRDYGIEGANVNVIIDSDKIEVNSPGKPIVPVEKMQNFTASTFSTNPKIANVFYQMGFIEKRNLGMKELHDFAGLSGFKKPRIKYDEPYLQVSIDRLNKVKVEPKLDEQREFFNKRGKISLSNYAAHFGLTPKTAQRHLSKLVSEGILEREGKTKGAKYFLNL